MGVVDRGRGLGGGGEWASSIAPQTGNECCGFFVAMLCYAYGDGDGNGNID